MPESNNSAVVVAGAEAANIPANKSRAFNYKREQVEAIDQSIQANQFKLAVRAALTTVCLFVFFKSS